MGRTTRNSMKNIGDDQKGIERNKREKRKKDQKGLMKKRKKKKLRKEEQRSGMKKIRQERQGIYTMSCRKFSEQKFLREGYCCESP